MRLGFPTAATFVQRIVPTVVVDYWIGSVQLTFSTFAALPAATERSVHQETFLATFWTGHVLTQFVHLPNSRSTTDFASSLAIVKIMALAWFSGMLARWKSNPSKKSEARGVVPLFAVSC